MELRVPLEKPQRLALRAFQPGTTTCIPWGRGGGKSWFQRFNWWLKTAEYDGRNRIGSPIPGVRIVLLMPGLVQARKVHEQRTLDELRTTWEPLGGHLNRSEWKVSFPGGSWIQWVSAEQARSNRGIRCDIACLDEADDIDLELVDAIAEAWFTEPHSLRMMMVGGTPTRGRYGLLYRTHARGIGKMVDADGNRFTDHRSFHATCYDFPRFVSPIAIEKARLKLPPTVFKREWLCDFDAAEGLVYGNFDEDHHVRDPLEGMVWSEVLVGADHGYEDPGCFLVIGIAGRGEDATAHVIHEIYEPHRLEDWWVDRAKEIVAWFPNAKWYPDPSMPARIEALRTKARIKLGDVDNSIEDGVGTVGNLLVKRRHGDTGPEFARLYVAKGCKNTIREMGVYRRKRDPRNAERVLDDIEDKNNHAMDALRYPLFARFRTKTSSGRNANAGAQARE